MKTFVKQLMQQALRDKNGEFSLRECVIAVLTIIMTISWAAEQFLHKPVPEFMFYSFTSLIAAGCFGYSIEKKSFTTPGKDN